MKLEHEEFPGGALLCDRELGVDPSILFDRGELAARSALAESRGGRGSVSYITLGPREFVLRRYLRGGWAARISRDRYLWLGEQQTRPFREFRLLAELVGRGLPVPRPVAARYLRRHFTYSGELVTERLAGAVPLAERWRDGDMRDRDWADAGRCIRRFHDAGVQHADLNANNIMLDGRGGVWLLDFDRGRTREPGGWWERPLARLARSLQKLSPAGDDWRGRMALLRQAHDRPGAPAE
jgi:3-deoxy-D-manno-octulosonic acid kinase